MTEPTFFLSADSLLSKWGFGDGDGLDDWWWYHFDEPAPFDSDDALEAVVRAHLVPAMEAEGWTVELCRIKTSHNPVRAESLNGEAVDWYRPGRNVPTWVEVTRAQIEAAVEAP